MNDAVATKHPDTVDRAEGRDPSVLGRAVRTVVILLAAIGGGITGFALTLAIIVLRARAGHYIFALHDLVALRWETLPVAILMVAGFVLGVLRPRGLDRAIAWGLIGLAAGSALGAVAGRIVWGPGEGAWSGAIVFGALGLTLAGLASFHRRSRPSPYAYAGIIGTSAILLLAVSGLMGATHLIEEAALDFDPTDAVPVPDAADVDAVVFLVGDAGATSTDRSPLIRALRVDVEHWSDALARDSAVSVVLLGDNVYPVGVRARTHPRFAQDTARLWNQIRLVGEEASTRHSTLGLFVPGNHDWGNTAGDEGYERIRNQAEQIDDARTRGLHVALVPADGSPGPAVRDLRSNARLLFLDTHWFLQARSGEERAAFFDRLREGLEDAGDRATILLSHHPFATAGPHGALLPGNHIGGVSYLLQKAGALVQDLNSPAYAEFLTGLRTVFEQTGRPPLLHAGGHDHSLQVLSGGGDFDPRFAVVSGAGSKASGLQMATGLLWGADRPGWMMLVFRKDEGVDLFVAAGAPGGLACDGELSALDLCMNEGESSFDIVYSATLREASRRSAPAASAGTPWWAEETAMPLDSLPDEEEGTVIPPPVAVPLRALAVGTDSILTTPGRTYPAGRVRRLLFGDLNRHLWELPVRLPVLDLDSAGGGLRPIELVGGKQTLGLRFVGRDGATYEFRSVVKDARRALPDWLRIGFVMDALDDQMAAQFPLAAVVVSDLLAAAGIVAPAPVPVVMPNDPLLGPYRPLFAGRVGLFAPQANEREGGRPGFGGHSMILDDGDLEDVLDTDSVLTFDDRYFLRIRYLDMLIGDWDRHAGQWNWAVVEDSAGRRYRAIPEDRDWAFSRIDGILPGLVRRFRMKRYVGFGDAFPPIDALTQAGSELDRRILNRMSLADFEAVAAEVRAAITDSVIDSALSRLPERYVGPERDRLASALRQRRDGLADLARDYYALVAADVHIYGSPGAADVVTFERVESGVRVRLESAGALRFERVLDGDTRKVTVHTDPASARVQGGDELPFEVELVERGIA